MTRVLFSLIACIVLEFPVYAVRPWGTLFEHVRPWLPPDMETVYVTNVPITRITPTTYASVVQEYAGFAVSVLAGVKNASAVHGRLANLTVAKAVYSGRRFGPVDAPEGLGVLGEFEGCSFLRCSRPAVSEVLGSLDQEHLEVVMGTRLYELRYKDGSLRAGFVAAIEPDLLLLCTGRSIAFEILYRKKHGSRAGVFPALRFAKHWIDERAMFWGFREFQKGHPDPTSPLNPAPSILPAYKDPEAIAMVFAMGSPSRASVTYLTRNKTGYSYAQTWNTVPRVNQRHGYLAVVFQYDPSNDFTDRMSALLTITLFGIVFAL